MARARRNRVIPSRPPGPDYTGLAKLGEKIPGPRKTGGATGNSHGVGTRVSRLARREV